MRWPLTPIQRFMTKVELIPEHPCWEWNSQKNMYGYGKFYIGNKEFLAHRFSFEMHRGHDYDTFFYKHRRCSICHRATVNRHYLKNSKSINEKRREAR